MPYDDPFKRRQISLHVSTGDRLDHKPSNYLEENSNEVAIARAFVSEPPILLLMNPLETSIRETGRVVEEVLFELQQETKTTVILVTHDLESLKRRDRVLVMSGGRLVSEHEWSIDEVDS